MEPIYESFSAIFVVNNQMRIKEINNTCKSLFNLEDKKIINQLLGNIIGCSFVIESGLPCGFTLECKNCLIRNYITKYNFYFRGGYSFFLSRAFYINKKPIVKYFKIKIKNMVHNNELLTIIEMDSISKNVFSCLSSSQ